MSAGVGLGPPDDEGRPPQEPARIPSPPSEKITLMVPDVPVQAVAINAGGRAVVYVSCPYCGGLHQHSTSRSLTNTLAGCHGGRYSIVGRTVHAAPRVVPCRVFAGDECVACGPGADQLFAGRVFELHELRA